MSPITLLRAIGVVIFGAFLYHQFGSPWAIVATAGIAMMILP